MTEIELTLGPEVGAKVVVVEVDVDDDVDVVVVVEVVVEVVAMVSLETPQMLGGRLKLSTRDIRIASVGLM